MKQRIARYISSKLTLVILLPCILLSAIILYDVIMAYGKMVDAGRAQANTLMSESVLNLVHETQKERGASAGFLGSGGDKFSAELAKQRLVTNERLQSLQDKLEDLTLSEGMEKELKAMLKMFVRLQQVRTSVDSLSISLSEALKYYTDINKQGLHLVITASRETKESLISTELFAIYNFSNAKEASGIERAVLANTFAADEMSPVLSKRHTRLLAAQELFLYEALEASPSVLKRIFQSALQHQVMSEVDRFRKAVDEQTSGFGVDPQRWFKLATERINVLKTAEEGALQAVVETASSVIAKARLTLIVELAILFAGVLITAALLLSISLRMTQNGKIAEGIRIALNEKNLAHEIEIISDDDLGEIARNVNALTEGFAKDLEELSNAASGISRSTSESAVALNQSKANLMEQQSGVQTIASASEEMSANIQVIANSMGENSETTRLVAEECIVGQRTVSDAVEVIQHVSEEMAKSAKTVDELNERVGSISSMVEMIRSIADQTNLLALNAAIEAARAGEQGRGFAVVADEVRSLASRTQQSTDEISALVTELQTSSKGASEVITVGKENANQAASKAEEIRATLDEIVRQVKQVETITESTTASTKQQSDAVEEVSKHAVVIFEKATENVAGAQQISIAAEKIAEAAADMDLLIKRYQI